MIHKVRFADYCICHVNKKGNNTSSSGANKTDLTNTCKDSL